MKHSFTILCLPEYVSHRLRNWAAEAKNRQNLLDAWEYLGEISMEGPRVAADTRQTGESNTHPLYPARGVVILRSSPIDPDPRVEKVGRAIFAAGFRVRAVGWDRSCSLPRTEERPYGQVERIWLRAPRAAGLRNLPYLLRWHWHLLAWLVRNNRGFDVIHACDFDTVIPAILVKWFLRKKVVYDVFDFYADMLRKAPSFVRRVIRATDLWLMGRVDAVVLADEIRKEQIRGARPRRLVFIYNSPESVPPLGREGVKEGHCFSLRIAYVGLLKVDRGLLQVLQILTWHPDWWLDLAGLGGDEEIILEYARRLPNVEFHGRIPYEEALRLSARADILFATYDPAVPNHRYSSPNKLFEAMALGKPIVVARGTGADQLVEHYGLGFVVEYGNVEQLEDVLNQVASWSREVKSTFAKHAQGVYMEHFCWQRMNERLINLYQSL